MLLVRFSKESKRSPDELVADQRYSFGPLASSASHRSGLNSLWGHQPALESVLSGSWSLPVYQLAAADLVRLWRQRFISSSPAFLLQITSLRVHRPQCSLCQCWHLSKHFINFSDLLRRTREPKPRSLSKSSREWLFNPELLSLVSF